MGTRSGETPPRDAALLTCRFWVVCADMAAQYSVPDPTTPGKMFMNYQGLASYLSSGGEPPRSRLTPPRTTLDPSELCPPPPSPTR